MISICFLEYFSHGCGQVHIILLALSNLDEHGHNLVKFFQADMIVTIGIEQVENTSQVVFSLASTEQVQKDHSVGHGNFAIVFLQELSVCQGSELGDVVEVPC